MNEILFGKFIPILLQKLWELDQQVCPPMLPGTDTSSLWLFATSVMYFTFRCRILSYVETVRSIYSESRVRLASSKHVGLSSSESMCGFLCWALCHSLGLLHWCQSWLFFFHWQSEAAWQCTWEGCRSVRIQLLGKKTRRSETNLRVTNYKAQTFKVKSE